ncbi:MAG: hypothetical protein ACYDCK_02785 [Thermoplasmatota archaeon]
MKRLAAVLVVAALVAPGLARGAAAPADAWSPYPSEYRELALKWVGDAKKDLALHPPPGPASNLAALTNATNAADKDAQSGRLRSTLVDLVGYSDLKALYTLWDAVGNETSNRTKTALIERTGEDWYAAAKTAEADFRARLNENAANYSSLLTLEGAMYAADLGVEARSATDGYSGYAQQILPGDPDKGVVLGLAQITEGPRVQFGYATDILVVAERHEGTAPKFVPGAWHNITNRSYPHAPANAPEVARRFYTMIDEARPAKEDLWAEGAFISLQRSAEFTNVIAQYTDAAGRRNTTADMTSNVDRSLANSTLPAFQRGGLDGLEGLDAMDIAAATRASGATDLNRLARAWIGLEFSRYLASAYVLLSPERVVLAGDPQPAPSTDFVLPALGVGLVAVLGVGALVWVGRRSGRK